MIGKRRYFSEGTVSFLKKGISNFLLQTQSEGDIFGSRYEHFTPLI